ncbi:MAG: CBS domain-containing protein [Gammaproteobacteria bacterium]|jgi:CBS domain-containing membrane protein|nr:CBS domain-containing protein [Gammaproteobacteria bacterium]
MSEEDVHKLQPNDFAMALQEQGTYIDVSVDDLMQLYHAAERYARIRKSESVLVEKIMMQPVTTVQADCSLSEAAHLLVTLKISGLPVVDKDNRLVGIITEADFLHELGMPSRQPDHNVWKALENMFSHHVEVRELEGEVADLMVSKVITVSPQQTLHQALEVMKQHTIRRLVVCDEARHVVGLITRSDLVRVFFDHFKSDNEG